ncbi:hypothetical protein [Streptomyces aurantiacus]|uniref:hypothetical protein n=1 Tax=Streptomyces aurantiacus TaxID=47760 RepID=UPI0006E28986|nr:hypothetical protein [Streptomyces aurantiacus]
MRKRLAAASAAAAAIVALVLPTAAQATMTQTSTPSAAAAWTPTTTVNNGPIRECYAAGCDEVWRPGSGSRVYWSHYAINPDSDNRWYYVRYTSISGDSLHDWYGWIYCGNVTASC